MGSKFGGKSMLNDGQTIERLHYQQTLIRLQQAIKEKRPEWEITHESLIFHHENVRPHAKTFLENRGWEVLTDPPNSPDLAPSNYHKIRSMQNALTGICFTSIDQIKNWLDSFLAAKWDGINELPQKWGNE